MNINKVGTDTYGPLESSASVQNVGRKIRFEHRAIEPFSAAKRQGNMNPIPLHRQSEYADLIILVVCQVVFVRWAI